MEPSDLVGSWKHSLSYMPSQESEQTWTFELSGKFTIVDHSRPKGLLAFVEGILDYAIGKTVEGTWHLTDNGTAIRMRETTSNSPIPYVGTIWAAALNLSGADQDIVKENDNRIVISGVVILERL